jgi:hypothetical protein
MKIFIFHCQFACAGLLLLSVILPANVVAQEDQPDLISPLNYVAPKTVEMLIGVQITPGDGNVIETSAQTVFPTQWPEQTVEVVEANIPAAVQYKFRDLPGNNRQLLFFMPLISPGDPIVAQLKVRIEKSHIVGPTETSQFVAPRRPSSTIKQYLSPSPYIDSNNAEIKRIVKQIDASEPPDAWKRVELLYDWVRDNIVYTKGELKNVQQALRDLKGDCEEMTSIFVALCRAARVPARCVWVPGHCYPEFYLEDKDGKGHWFPCQVAGTRNFGNMPDYMPILQKVDRFKVPERNEIQRYLADYLTSKKVVGKRDPKVVFIRQLLGDAGQLPPADADGLENLQETDQASGQP